MNRVVTIGITVAGVGLFTASSAWGQNLSDRIDHVLQQRAEAQRKDTSKAALLGSLLYTDVSVEFSEQPAREVLKYLQTILGTNILARYSDDRASNGVGIDPETPVTLNASGKPGLTVLEMILDQCGGDSADTVCTWQLRDGYIEVGPKERLNLAREIRYYPIKDLLFEAPQFDNAPELDLNSALNQAQNSGGGGGGSGGGGGGRGGGGGGGGSSGGGGGGGGSGSVIGDPSEDPERMSETERAEQIIELITATVEPDAWEDAGGSAASIRYYQGVLMVRAPDYIHRQIGGYPFAARVSGAQFSSADTGGRYVMFTGGLSDVKLKGIEVSKQVGGTTGTTGGSGGSTTAGATTGEGTTKADSNPKPASKPTSTPPAKP